MNGIYPGKRIISYQKRILSYCQLHNIKIDKHFGDEEVTKIAVIDWSIEQRPLLLKETFNREIDVYRFLKEKISIQAIIKCLILKQEKNILLRCLKSQLL